MTAQDNLSPDQFPAQMYHYSAGKDSLGSVMKQGLKTRNPKTGSSLAEDDGGPAGVYMYRDKAEAETMTDGHLWAVTTRGMDLRPDPQNPKSAAYTPNDVPRGNLSHLRGV